MYSKFITAAVVLTTSLTTSAAVVYPRDGSSQPTSVAQSTTVWRSSTNSGTPTISGTPTQSFTPSRISTSISVTSTGTQAGKPSQAPQNVPCNGIQPWQANLAYNGGAQVTYNNQLWTASQWSYNNPPGSAAGQWNVNGVCNQPISTNVVCTNIPSWNQSAVYLVGSKVTFNGHLWVTTQWSQSNKPGDTSGLWKDLGAC